MTLKYVILFLVIKMKIYKKVSFLIVVFLMIVLILGGLYIKNYAMISESSKTSYIIDDSDIIGSINIESINLNRNLVQGLDNTFYFSHNYRKNISNNGEFFLDFQGDLLNNNNPIIYSKKENIRFIDNLKMGDIIRINYLDNTLCYEIFNNENSDLLLKIYDNDLIVNIFAKKIVC